MKKQEIVVNHNLNESLNEALNQCEYDKLFLLMDDVTAVHCLPLLAENPFIKQAKAIMVLSGDKNKDINAATDRKSTRLNSSH